MRRAADSKRRFRHISLAGIFFQGGAAALDPGTVLPALVHGLTGSALAVGAALIDSIDNDVEEKYISLPMRLYLVGADGRIVYTGDRGPFGFNPDTWEDAIKKEIGA